MRAFLAILVALLVGCRDQRDVELHKLQAAHIAEQSNEIAKFEATHGKSRREDDPAFSTEDRRIIAAAKRHLESGERKVDAYYKVTRRDDHFEVHVSYVTGYRNGQPVFIPGGFCVVLVRADESVIRVLPGA